MHWQFHQVMLPLVASGLVALSMAIVGLRRRHIVGAWFFVGITLLLAAWCLGYILEIGSLSLADKMIWISAQYTVIAFIPVFWFVFAVRYISWGERPEPHLILLLSCLPLITVIIVWTNPYHELMYRHLALDVGPLLTMVRMEYGPWFWVHTIYCYLLLAAGMFFVGWRMVRGPNVFRGQATSLFVAALIPWLGNAVYILSGRAPLRLDPTPLFFIISCTAMAWGLFRFDLLNLLPVAREAVIENMEDAVLVLDGGDRVVDLNPAALALCKGSPSSIVGHRLQETAFPGRETFQRYLHMLAARAEVTVDTPDGHLALDFRLSPLKDRRGRVRGRLILLRDVTERVRAEERLRENLALLSALIDSLRIAAMVEDDHGTIVHANRMAHILFPELCTASQPLPAEGAVLARLADLVAEPALLTGQIVEPFQNGQTIAPVEMPLRDGRILECEVIPLPMNQEHHGRLWLWRDVTERRHQEQLARQRHKMEAIGRLAGGIAHDFNNLLTVINGYSQLVWRALPAESPLREKLMRIRQAGDEAANLTRQLLLFSRPPTLKAGPQDLNAVVRDMQRMLSHLLGKRITLEIALAPGLRPVWSDVSYLEELLVNLATNARDAIYALPALDGEEDRVRIETASRIIEPGAPETHEGLAPGEYVLLSVSDNGRGLTSEEQAHLFEPFYTCQTLGEGTGLALAVVYGLVEQLGGTIRVESRPDRGSTFNVLLPCVSQSEEERSYALDVDSSAR